MNHLAGEPSLYLQQHAANPLDWHPWSDEALEKARAEDKPLFVSVGYSSCHWCHVMEHEVFEDGEVAELMNAHFIAIKIDREERPDLDAVFMEALHVLTGAGGWPLNLFLTPELKPFYGATYLPRGQFLDVARQIVQLHQRDRDRLEQAGAEVARILAARPVIGGGALPGKDLLARAAESALEQLDPDWGGFRGRMKFPLPPRLEFLLGRYRREGDQRLGYALALTLDAIAGGGIRDHLGGGFHRYATDEAWIVPHFEKMLYDNAQLASLYLEAGAAFKRPDLRAVALDTLDFMLERMRAGEGGAFCASYDADSGGVEGAYYTWTPDEIIAVAGKDDGLLLCRLLGVTPAGNFEGGNVLTRRIPAEDLARERGVSAEDVERTYLKWRPALLAERDRRTAPARDAKVVTAWNGMALRALALAALATGGERYLQAAEEAAAYLLARHVRPDGRLWRATTDGVARGEGVLDDYAWLARGLCALFQASGRPAYLRQALGLIDAAFALFAREGGGFSLATADADAPLGAPEPLFDNVEPAGASTLLRALLEAGTLTARRDYIERVRSELARHGGLLAQAGMEMAGWLSALELVLGPLPCVIVTGRRDNPAARKLRDAFGAQLPPHAMLVQATPDAAAELGGLVPPAEGKDAADPAAHNCTQDACLPPVRDAAELRRLLREGWQA